MKRIYLLFLFLIGAIGLLQAQKVVSITIDGAINPIAADYIQQGIQKASEQQASCLLIHLNTPGGLLQSTRTIVSHILESPVPVVVYVSPAGSRAGSAGVFITLAANIAAMAPGTNIGAAHPVAIQGGMDSTMNEKATNDAAAFIRTIAEKRNRNLQWAEDAVRKSISITEKEALEEKVIDLIADNTKDLLAKIDGKSLETASGTVVLHTKGAQIIKVEMGSTDKILDLISDPNIMYILMLLGFFGILFEFYNPGAILPGIVGVISLILALYGMSTLPINYAGLALIVFGIVLFLLELKITSHGMLAVGGIVSLLFGSIMLIRQDSALEFARISRSIIFSSVAISTVFFLFVIGLGLRAQRATPVTGIDGLEGETGKALDTLSPTGRVWVHGENWHAESISGTINKDADIRVVSVKNLTLVVESLNHTKQLLKS